MPTGDKLIRPVEILLVEDSLEDAELTTELLNDSDVPHNIHLVRNGIAALEYLYQKGQYQDRSLPDLIILDLNLPRKNGHEVLAEIKSNPQLRKIPTIILSTSTADQDIDKALDRHANCYVVKSANLERFMDVIQSVEQFWLKTNHFQT
jgi:chemotaxis family two-component system response regulator Rcp1